MTDTTTMLVLEFREGCCPIENHPRLMTFADPDRGLGNLDKFRMNQDMVITGVHASTSRDELFSHDGLHIHVEHGDRITFEGYGYANLVVSKVHPL